MKIEVKAKLILTVPMGLVKSGSNEDIILAAEQHINDKAAVFEMPKTKTQVGIRIHVSGKVPKVIQ